MIDFTKPVQTRDGRKVEILTTKGRGPKPIIGYMGSGDTVWTWRAGGKMYPSVESDLDLINVPEKRVAYVNFYPYGASCRAHNSRKSADECAEQERVARVRVEYEEGQYDE